MYIFIQLWSSSHTQGSAEKLWFLFGCIPRSQIPAPAREESISGAPSQTPWFLLLHGNAQLPKRRFRQENVE